MGWYGIVRLRTIWSLPAWMPTSETFSSQAMGKLMVCPNQVTNERDLPLFPREYYSHTTARIQYRIFEVWTFNIPLELAAWGGWVTAIGLAFLSDLVLPATNGNYYCSGLLSPRQRWSLKITVIHTAVPIVPQPCVASAHADPGCVNTVNKSITKINFRHYTRVWIFSTIVWQDTEFFSTAI